MIERNLLDVHALLARIEVRDETKEKTKEETMSTSLEPKKKVVKLKNPQIKTQRRY